MREKSRRGDGHILEQQLIDAATKLLVESQGFQPPSLRAVARECGVSPSAIYLHFSSQAELTRRVVVEQFDALRRALVQTDDPSQTADQRLTALGTAYTRWAVENEGAYQLLFDTPDVDPPAGVTWAPGLDLLGLPIQLFEELGNDEQQATRLATTLWSSWHGLISLRRNSPAAPWTHSLEDDASYLASKLIGDKPI